MTLVVDASVAAKWLITEPDSELAGALRTYEMVAPPLFRMECASALIRRMRIGQLTPQEVRPLMAAVGKLPVLLRGIDEAQVFELAIALKHPVYDCAYLALAHDLDLMLVTADRRFIEAVQGTDSEARVILLADFAADPPHRIGGAQSEPR